MSTRTTLPFLSTSLIAAVVALLALPGAVARAAQTTATIPGLGQVLDPTVIAGQTIGILGPPSTARDRDTTGNSVEAARPLMESRKAPGSIYQTIRPDWLTVQFPSASLSEISGLVRQQYDDLVMTHVNTPSVTGIGVQHQTYVYPVGYDQNGAPVTVHARRFTLDAAGRTLVGYYVNYDRIADHNGRVMLQVNGHFGSEPSKIGLGLKDRGGLLGGALGKIAMRGLPMIVYDDHNVGESSGAPDSLHRTLENIQMIDRTLLVHFNAVDTVGLSGGTERLYHFMNFFESNVLSSYFAGYFNPNWTFYDATHGVNSPFGVNNDTYNDTFFRNFQQAEMALVGLDRGVLSAFAHAAFEGGRGKYGYFEEMLPVLRQYTDEFQTRGDDTNGDGVPDYGPGLAHEYNLPDLFDWLEHVRTIPEPASLAVIVLAAPLLLRRRLTPHNR